MSKQIDERVVSMQFDNKNFESNVQTTLGTLDKLKRGLRLDGAAKGLETVDAAAKKVDMSTLSRGVETVRTTFSGLEVMAVTALANITNSAVNAGKRIAASLTIEPITAGFSEYETQINAVQTILSNTRSKGTTLDNVNSALDELNTYADKTIYNFTEMTRNIGTFTAAGVDLDTSVSAIKGIANLAAVSGSNSQQASTAMYQLSQALSSGIVKLMDWNSVVNAGMGGQVFQDALKETAKVHGVNVDAMIKKEGSFRETLQNGWLTSEILTDTLAKFTGDLDEAALKKQGYTDEQIKNIIALGKDANDAATKVKTLTQLFDTLKEAAQSGWTQTWEILVGDFEEAREMFTKVSDTLGELIGSSAEARNKVLSEWKDLGGRTHVIDAIKNAFEGVMDIIKPVSEAFREIFPPVTAEQLANLSKGLKNLTEKFKIGKTTADNLKRTFKGVFAFFDIGVQAVKALFSGFAKLIGYVAPAGDGILGFTAKIGDFIVRIDEALKSSNAFGKIIEGIGAFLKPIAEGVKAFGKSISDTIGNVADKAGERLGPLSALGEFIKGIFTGIGKLIGKIFPFVSQAASGIGNVLSGLMDKISTSIQNADYNSIFDIINGGIFSAIGVFIAKFIKAGGDLLDNAGGFLDKFGDILDGVSDSLNAFTGKLKAETLKTIATAIGILALSLVAISLIDSEKLTASLAAISALFIELMLAMKAFTKISDGKGLKDMAAMYVMGSAMKSLASALLVLAIAMKIMSTMSLEEMGVALISLTVGLGELVGAVYLLSKMPEKDLNGSVKAIKKLSSALLVLSVALVIMGSMSWRDMGVALISMAVGLGALVGAVHLLPKDADRKAGKIVTLASAMVILGVALKIMGSMSWRDMGVALISMAVGLGAMVGAIHLLPKDADRKVGQIMTLAAAMVVLGTALKIMSSMSWAEMGVALISMAVGLGAMVGAIHLLKNVPDLMKIAGSLIVLSSALLVLSLALKVMSSMSWEEMGIALVSLAGSLLILVGVGALLAYAAPAAVGALLALAGAVALFGVGVAAVGVGVLALGAGITMLAAALAASGGAIVVFVSSLISLIPYLIEQIGVGLIKLCEVIAGGAAAICEAVTVIILAVVDALVASVPAIVDGVFVLVMSLLDALVEYTPKIVVALFDFLIGILNAIADKLPDLIQAGVNLLMSFLTGVIDALRTIDPNILIKGILAIGFLEALMIALASMALLAPAALVGVVAMGAVITELAIVLAAIGALAQIPGLQWLINEGGEMLQSIGTAIGKFLGGIVGGIAQGMSSALPQIGKDLADFMTNAKPFIDGAKSFDASTLSGVKALVEVILALTGANIIDGLTSWFTGGSSLTKFGEEIAAFAPHLKTYADTVKGIDGSAVAASALAAQTLSELAANLPNSGGLAGWFAGENDIGTFGEQLVPFGEGMKAYSDSISGFNPEAVIASANAAKALADMSNYIPNEGGLVAWFAGDNSVAKFGDELVILGEGLKSYSESIVGFNPEAVIASANAAKALVDMTSHIPNEGGMVAWFTGENSMLAFASQLSILGNGLKGYSDSIIGFNPEAVIASANAAKALAEMTSHIPNSGGMAAWFAGENSVAQFGADLIALGVGLRGFSDAVSMGDGINIESMTAATNAATALAQMANTIPNQGGVASWFAGENSISKFGTDLIALGQGLKGFSDAISEGNGINPESLIAASNAAKTLAEMTTYIPNEGGISAWFSGESSVSKFSTDLVALGAGLRGFSDAISEGKGINPEALTAAAGAAKAIAEMTTYIPNEGGISAWFTGESNISTFADKLPALGAGLKGFSDELGEGINPEALTAAASAAKALAEMTTYIPTEGGIKAWFTGESNVAGFADNLPKLGEGLKNFSDSLEGIVPENLTAGANAGKTLAEMTKTVPEKTEKLGPYGENLKTFGTKLKGYFDETSGITAEAITASTNAINSVKNISGLDSGKVEAAANAVNKMVEMIKGMSGISAESTSGFSSALSNLGKDGITAFTDAFKDADSKMSDAAKTLIDKFVKAVDNRKSTLTSSGKDAIEKFIKGITASASKAESACTKLISACAKAIKSKTGDFNTAGVNLVKGFAAGITETTFLAEAKAKAMAAAAAKAAKKELDEHSPSKVFYGIGKFAGLGFVNAIGDYVSKARSAGSGLADASIEGMNNAISKVSDIISNDIDAQPTIRPVLDLSDVESGASAIGGMLSGRRTLSLNTQSIGALSASMDKLQNGRNSNELVSTMKALRKDISDMPRNTYSIGGISVNEEGAVADAIKTLVRVAKIERRA